MTFFIYFVCFIALIEQSKARYLPHVDDALKNPYSKNEDLLQLLNENDYDMDLKNSNMLDKSSSKDEQIKDLKDVTYYAPDYIVDEDTKFKPKTNDNDEIINDYNDEGDAKQSTSNSKELLDNNTQKSKTQNKETDNADAVNKSNNEQELLKTTDENVQLTDAPSQLSDEDLDFVLRQLSLSDLRALSDYIDSKVIAEGTQRFLESNLRTPPQYIIRMNDENKISNSDNQDYLPDVKEQPNIKDLTQAELSHEKPPAADMIYRARFRTKRQNFYNRPTVDDEYLKLLAYSFPQDAREKSCTDIESCQTHVRVKRN